MTATQESIYEHLFALTTLMKQRVVDNFDGNALNERWQTGIVSGGTPTFAMADAVDEGFEIDSNSSASPDGGFIAFNNIRHYDHTASAFIAVWRLVSTSVVITSVGLHGDIPNLNNHRFEARVDTNFSSFYGLLTQGTGANSVTATDVSIDTNFHTFSGKITSSDAKLFIAGVLKATRTTLLPTAKLEPVFAVLQRGATAKQGHIRYYEAFNT